MKLLLFLLLAAAAPVMHHSAAPTPRATHSPTPAPTATPATESGQAVQDKRIADATVALAFVTFLLAIATTAAVIIPLRTARRERKQERIATLRHMLHLVDVFDRRIIMWSTHPKYNGDALMVGLDVAMTGVLSDEVIKVLGPTGTSTIVVRNIVNAYDQMATHRFDAATGGPSHADFRLTSTALRQAAQVLRDELKSKYGVEAD